MTPVVLFRPDALARDEFAVATRVCAARGVAVVTSRVRVEEGSLVFGRYSVLPFYEELAADLAHRRSRLVNAPAQHRWIASMAYARALARFTFPTWTADEFPRCDDPGPFVVKGATNSRKHHWDTMMFAPDRRAAIEVMTRLRQDSLIATQPIVFRKYVPLVTHEVGLNGVRFANEYRVFFLGRVPVASGYYWSEAADADARATPVEALTFAREVAEAVADVVPFFVLDVAEKEGGGWILVEVNDAQMSGLSMIDPEEFYDHLALTMESYGAMLTSEARE